METTKFEEVFANKGQKNAKAVELAKIIIDGGTVDQKDVVFCSLELFTLLTMYKNNAQNTIRQLKKVYKY